MSAAAETSPRAVAASSKDVYLDACQLEALAEVLQVRSGAGRPEDEPTSGGAVIRRFELKSKSNKRGQISNRYLTSAVKSQIEI